MITRPAVARAASACDGEHDGVVERGARTCVDGERRAARRRRRRGRDEKPVSCDRAVAERDDGDPVAGAASRATNARAAATRRRAPARHRLRAVDREHDALRAAEVDRLQAGHRHAVLASAARCDRRRRDDGDAGRAGSRSCRRRVIAAARPPRRAGEDERSERERRRRERAVLTAIAPEARRREGRPDVRRRRSLKNVGGRTTPFAASFSRKCGLRPGALRAARAAACRASCGVSSSGGLATKMSCSVITSDSMRSTSVMCVIRREPSTRREIWTSRSNALAICSRIARSGRSTPAVSTSVSSRESASRGEFAWIVVSEPSWPVFIAWSMSSVSAPRTSPTMIRSGRMRRAFRTSSRMRTSPWPSMFGGRDSSVITCSCWSWSSAASSIVTMRSSSGTNAESAFSIVVLPVPVPPEMRTFSFPCTQAARNCAACGGQRPERRSGRPSCTGRARTSGSSASGPRSASGGMIALTRLPSGRRASTIGDDSSMRRPTCETILSMIRSRCASSTNDASRALELARALDVDPVVRR